MTDRDHFAAAALTGLLYPEVDDEFAMPYIVGRAYLWADAMLRERAKTNHDAAPAATAQDLGTGDTTKPIKGGVSDRSKPINGPDPDSRVWETPVHTPAPHATRGEGSEQRECTEPVAWAVCNPVGVHYRSFGYHHEALECCLQKIRETGDRFYIRALHAAPPQGAVVRLPPLDPNGAPGWNAAIGAVREALADAGVDWDTE